MEEEEEEEEEQIAHRWKGIKPSYERGISAD